MRLSVAFSYAASLGFFSGTTTDAFLVRSPTGAAFSGSSVCRSMVGGGAGDEDQGGGGGSRFADMMSRSQQMAAEGGATPPQQMPPQQVQPQPQQYYDQYGNPVPPPPPQQYYDQYGNPIQMQPPPPPPQQQPHPQQQQQQQFDPDAPFVRTKGNPPARNPDAHTISNTSDVYFAQLKRDSTVRKLARMRGDTDYANQVFADDSVKKIKEDWKENPYLREENMEKSAAESAEMYRMYAPPAEIEEDEKSYTGISYKQKLEERMGRKKSQGGQAGAASVDVPPEVAPEPVVAAPDQAAAAAPEPVVAAPEPVVAAPEPVAAVVAPVAQEVPVQAAAPAASVPEAASATRTDDDVRRLLRTTQGLILKHRGGPGFGSGRLKAHEAKRLEDNLADVTAMIRSEAGMIPEATKAAAAAATTVEVAPVPAATASAGPVETEAAPAPAAPRSDDADLPESLSGAIACIEAAVKMYKESNPAEREGLLIPLRSALMSAVTTCNGIIAENEVANSNAYKEATVAKGEFELQPSPMSGSAASATAGAAGASTGIDANSAVLRETYDALKAAHGDQKFGLGNISVAEATRLADAITDMRGVLVEELESGVPGATATHPAPPKKEPIAQEAVASIPAEPATAAHGGSKYQEMLAKAKAAKAAKGL